MSNYVKVEGKFGLVRDSRSGAIINTNKKEIAQARSRKKLWKAQQEEISDLKNDVSLMKEMLIQLLEDKNGNNSNQS
jgi:hypothetical protein|tara:strand:+ start:765 stop:995 length:231 start_codon:yes stop_codon:yes gene_type:complete